MKYPNPEEGKIALVGNFGCRTRFISLPELLQFYSKLVIVFVYSLLHSLIFVIVTLCHT